MFRSLFALMLVLVVTALPVQAQPRQPSPIRFVQSSSGALFLTQEPSAWPLIPDQISDDDLAALTPRSQTNVLPVDPLFRPEPRQRVVQGSDGTLYDIIDGDANTDGVWPLVPDQISDTDLASLSLGSEIDGTIPPGLATNNALSDTVPATAAPVGSLPTQTTSQQQAPAPPVNEGDADTSTPAAPTAPGQPSPVASDGFDYSGATDYGCPGATARIELNQPGTGVITSEQARTWSGNTAEGFPGRYAITLLGHTQYKITATMTPAPGTPSIQLLHLGAFGPHALTSGQWSCSYNTQLTSRVVCISDASVSFSCTFTTDLPGTYVIGVAIEPLGFHQQPGAPKFPSELPYTVTVVNQAPGSTQAPTPTASTTAQGDWLALCANDNFWQGIPNLKTVEVGETISSMITLDELRDSGVGRFPNNFRVTLPGRTWYRVSLKLSQPLAGGLRLQIAGPQGTTCRGAILAAARVPVLPQLPDKLLSEYSFQSSLPGPVLISVDLAYTARVAVAYTFKVDVDTDPPR